MACRKTTSISFGDYESPCEWEISYDASGEKIVEERERELRHIVEYEYDEDGSLLSIHVEERLQWLPANMYIQNGNLVSVCENSEFILMPLSKALAQQNSAE